LSSRTETSIRRILHPHSVAVFGASENRDKFGGRIAYFMNKHGFRGRMVGINPGRSEVFGNPCYASIGAAPGPIDVAMLAVPNAGLPAAIRECAEAGVGCCVVITTGFAEASAEGAANQAEMVAVAGAAGMRLLGPNCMGFINPGHRLCLCSSVSMDVDGLLEGEVGLISQSGALMVSVVNRAHRDGIGFSVAVSLGNQSDLEICDFLEYMIDDSETSAICLYVEGFKDGPRFLRAAEAAAQARKPLILVKAGRTAEGVRAARSHTASLAGDYAVLEAACRERGVLLTDDPDGMVLAARMLSRWGEPAGDGIGVLSPSGGGVSICSDRLPENGLRLATLSTATQGRLRKLLIEPQVANPVDLGPRLDGVDPIQGAAAAMEALAADPDVSALLMVLLSMPFFTEVTEAATTAAMASGKPLVTVVTVGESGDGSRDVLRRLGPGSVDRLDDALRMLRIWRDWGTALTRPPAVPGRPEAVPRPLEVLPTGTLTEPEAKAVLAGYGIPVNSGLLAADEDQAVTAATALGYPVALKVVSRQVVHKSDLGAVKLGLADPDQVRLAFTAATAGVRSLLPDAQIEGCLVQEMAAGEAELIVGIRRDAQYGPVLVVGSGGILAEVLRDFRVALAPLGHERALELLRELRLWPLLEGVRGNPALDVEAAADVIVRMSWLAADLGERLEDLEINPLMVRAAGAGVVAVDARGHLGAGA